MEHQCPYPRTYPALDALHLRQSSALSHERQNPTITTLLTPKRFPSSVHHQLTRHVNPLGKNLRNYLLTMNLLLAHSLRTPRSQSLLVRLVAQDAEATLLKLRSNGTPRFIQSLRCILMYSLFPSHLRALGAETHPPPC